MNKIKNKIAKLQKNEIIELINFCNELIKKNVVLPKTIKVEFFYSSIQFKGLTEIPYADHFDHTKCEEEIQELFNTLVEWSNFDDVGYLVVSFNSAILDCEPFQMEKHEYYYNECLRIVNSCF